MWDLKPFCYIKVHWFLSYILMDLLSTCDFESACIGHLRNNCLLSYEDFSVLTYSQYNIKKSHSLISPLSSPPAKSLSIGSSQVYSSRNVFQNSDFCMKLEFYHLQ